MPVVMTILSAMSHVPRSMCAFDLIFHLGGLSYTLTISFDILPDKHCRRTNMHMNEAGPRRPLISHKPAFLTIKDVSSVIVEFILI